MKLPAIECVKIESTVSFGWSHELILRILPADRFAVPADVGLEFSWSGPDGVAQRVSPVHSGGLTAQFYGCGADMRHVESAFQLMRDLQRRFDRQNSRDGYASSRAEEAIRFWTALGCPTVRRWNETDRAWTDLSDAANGLRYAVESFERERDAAAESFEKSKAHPSLVAERAS